MDRGGAGSATLLRKRSLSVNTTASAAAAAIDQFGSKRQGGGVAAAVEEEPVSPTGRLFREPHFRCHIVSVFGLGAPVDLPALRAGVATTLARHPRFCSVQALASMMESSKDNGARWGNKLGYMLIPFHLAKHDDPIEYVRKATKVARRKKSSMESVFTFWSGDMVLKLFGIKAAAALCYGMFRHTTLSFSNMVGPTEQVLFCGNPIVYIAPGIYGHPHALTVHYQSYMNSVKLVLSVDEAQFPDSHQLLDDFAESLRLIRKAASGKPAGETQDAASS